MAATENGAASPHVGVNRLPTPPRMIVLGFYDGPTDGVIQLGDGGPVFRFTMPDEEAQLTRHTAAREYHLLPLPSGALDRLAAAIAPHPAPTWPVWIPIWRFPTPEAEQAVNAAVEAILADA